MVLRRSCKLHCISIWQHLFPFFPGIFLGIIECSRNAPLESTLGNDGGGLSAASKSTRRDRVARAGTFSMAGNYGVFSIVS
ncbi:hypothetical protein Y032_0005g2688 [Ancylostoma ceylanicum]|uniref:Uncharacterized protein n=1 Tax=Ancylostoma ceylanicum TaxID=53326 RepID=A0A016VT84_9BILA|nr:hypothetical protein Y032_0005g2688 [Ancylostoma ceylanicum]